MPAKRRKPRGPRFGSEIAMRLAAGRAIGALRAGVWLASCFGRAPTGQGDLPASRSIQAASGSPAESSGPWKWPGAAGRCSRYGCGIFSGPRIPACYVSGSVHGWPVAGWPRKRPGAVERGWRSGCAWFPGLKTRLLCARFHGSQALPAVLLR